MKRILQETKAGRGELVVHLSLGLATLVAVLNFFGAMVRLSSQSDRVAQTLFREAPVVVQGKAAARQVTLVTNAPAQPVAKPATLTVDVIVPSQSGASSHVL